MDDCAANSTLFVIPAKAGTQLALWRNCDWVPAFAGMTRLG